MCRGAVSFDPATKTRLMGAAGLCMCRVGGMDNNSKQALGILDVVAVDVAVSPVYYADVISIV